MSSSSSIKIGQVRACRALDEAKFWVGAYKQSLPELNVKYGFTTEHWQSVLYAGYVKYDYWYVYLGMKVKRIKMPPMVNDYYLSVPYDLPVAHSDIIEYARRLHFPRMDKMESLVDRYGDLHYRQRAISIIRSTMRMLTWRGFMDKKRLEVRVLYPPQMKRLETYELETPFPNIERYSLWPGMMRT